MATNIEIKRYSSGVWGTVYPKANWNNMDNKPSTFTPSSHTHSQYLEKTGANGLSEGTSDITDNTEILTSYASNNGFADTNAAGVIYRRDAVKMYNYIKGKLDSVYQPKGTYLTSHQDISGKLDKSGGTLTGPIKFSGEAALPQKDLQYIVGIDAFASGGEAGWMSKSSFLSGTVKYAGDKQNIGSGAPAQGAKDWVTTANLPNGNALVYDSSGSEFSLLYSFNPSNRSYGTILKWGYNNNYLLMLRYQGGSWYTTDWEKISAGYADNSGKLNNQEASYYLNYNNLSNKPTIPDISGKADKASITAGWYRRVQVNAQGIVIGGDQTDANDDTNTWRKVQLNGVDKLGNGISTNPLNIKAGSNVTITESSGTFTFAATDTTYESKAAASGGTAVSLVTTGEKYTWNNKANSSHTHSSINTVGDNRSVATKPNDYGNKIIFQGLKYGSTIGSPSSDTYSYLIGLRGWADSSGGNAHELAFNDTGIYIRNGATTSWGGWKKLATISDITSAIGDAIAASY